MAERTSLPSTEPHPAPIFDTGPHPGALRPLGFTGLDTLDPDAFLHPVNGHAEPVAVPAKPAVATAPFAHVRRWQFVFIVAAVWVLAAAAGLGFYFWWYTSLHKTAPLFAVLMYLIVCTLAAMLTSMVRRRPPVTALAIALMSAPLPSMLAAAVLHGAYYFEWIARPAVG